MVVAEGGQVTTRRAVAVLYHCSELRALSPLQERERDTIRTNPTQLGQEAVSGRIIS